MNISIDAHTATPTALRLTAAILTFIAGYKENPATAHLPMPTLPTMPIVAPPSPVVPQAPSSPEQKPPQVEDTTPPAGADTGADSVALLDSAGEAWNPDVHTANQSKTTDGLWRRKRTNKGEVASAPKPVELPKGPIVPPPPQAPVEPVAQVPTVPSAPATTAAVVTPVPPAPPASTGASPLTELGGDTFASLVKYVTNLVGAKKITTAQMLEACLEAGVPDIHACSKPENAALIAPVAIAISKKLPQ